MTDDEKAAVDWLELFGHRHADTIKTMLARPVLPARLDGLAMEVFMCTLSESHLHDRSDEAHIAVAWNALYAHLTKPRPKISILRALCIAKTLRGEGELGDALRLLADAYVERHGSDSNVAPGSMRIGRGEPYVVPEGAEVASPQPSAGHPPNEAAARERTVTTRIVEGPNWQLDGEYINDLQQRSITELVWRCKAAHHVDVHVRINGKWEIYQADWIKHLKVRP